MTKRRADHPGVLDRRSLLRRLGGAVAVAGTGLALPASWAASGRPSPSLTDDRRVRWAQGWLLWRDFKGRAIPFQEALANIRSAGCDGIEFTPRPGELDRMGLSREQLRVLLQGHGLSLSGSYLSARFYEQGEYQEIRKTLQERIDFLRFFGARNVVIGPPRVPEGTTDRLTLARRHGPMLNELGKEAADSGIEIGIHPHLNTTIETPAEIDVIMEETDPRYVRFSPDTGHIHLAGGNLEQILERYRERLNYFHVKDGVRPWNPPDFFPNLRPLGQGEVDHPWVMELLKRIGFSGWINVELDRTESTPEEASAEAMKYVDSRLKPILS